MESNKMRHLLCLCGAALLLMTVGSMTSFLFPLHTGVDQNCFLTVARAWLSGRLPYRDIFEQKGPLLYLLHIPAAAFPQTRFLGVYLVQAAAWVLLLCGIFAAIFMTHRDRYEKEAKRTDRRMKRERRHVLRIQRRQARHAKKYHRPTVR